MALRMFVVVLAILATLLPANANVGSCQCGPKDKIVNSFFPGGNTLDEMRGFLLSLFVDSDDCVENCKCNTGRCGKKVIRCQYIPSTQQFKCSLKCTDKTVGCIPE